MSHQKLLVSPRDSTPIYLQFGNKLNGKLPFERPAPPPKPKISNKDQQTKHQNNDLSSGSDSPTSFKQCYTSPPKKSRTNHKERKPSKVSSHERKIITQKLHEIDELRAKIIDLQWALSSHENVCAKTLEKKSTCCFGYLKRCNKKVEAPLFKRTPDNSKMTLDQMSTEVVFNSSRESLPKFYDEVEKTKRYRKRKKDKRRKDEKQVVQKHSQTEQTIKKNMDSEKNMTTNDKQSKITNNNTIVLPELFTSNKSSTEEMINLAEKLDAQNNEIIQIKISLQECLDLLRNKHKEKQITRTKSKSPERSKQIQSGMSKSMFDDYIFMNNRLTPSIITNYMKEREFINFLSPTKPQVFTCNTCESLAYSRESAPPAPPPMLEPCGLEDCGVLVSDPKAQLTVRKVETCTDRINNNKSCNNKEKCSTCCVRKSDCSTCYARKSKCSKSKCSKSMCSKSKCSKSKCYVKRSDCMESDCTTCCARRSQPRVVLVKYDPTKSSTACTNTSKSNVCINSDLIVKVTPCKGRSSHSNRSSHSRPSSHSNRSGHSIRSESGEDDRRNRYPIGKSDDVASDPDKHQDRKELDSTKSSGMDAEKCTAVDTKGRRRRRRRSCQSSHRRDGRDTTRNENCRCPPPKKGSPPCTGLRRKNCFIRCLLCMFCRNV